MGYVFFASWREGTHLGQSDHEIKVCNHHKFLKVYHRVGEYRVMKGRFDGKEKIEGQHG